MFSNKPNGNDCMRVAIGTTTLYIWVSKWVEKKFTDSLTSLTASVFKNQHLKIKIYNKLSERALIFLLPS